MSNLALTALAAVAMMAGAQNIQANETTKPAAACCCKDCSCEQCGCTGDTCCGSCDGGPCACSTAAKPDAKKSCC